MPCAHLPLSSRGRRRGDCHRPYRWSSSRWLSQLAVSAPAPTTFFRSWWALTCRRVRARSTPGGEVRWRTRGFRRVVDRCLPLRNRHYPCGPVLIARMAPWRRGETTVGPARSTVTSVWSPCGGCRFATRGSIQNVDSCLMGGQFVPCADEDRGGARPAIGQPPSRPPPAQWRRGRRSRHGRARTPGSRRRRQARCMEHPCPRPFGTSTEMELAHPVQGKSPRWRGSAYAASSSSAWTRPSSLTICQPASTKACAAFARSTAVSMAAE